MKVEILNNMVQIVILDISGVYAQIHNDGYFSQSEVEQIKEQYSDVHKWKVIEL